MSTEIAVAVGAYFYPKDAVKAERERALEQFKGLPIEVYAGVQDDGDEGFVAFVGSDASLDVVEAAWVGGERRELRDDISLALAKRFVGTTFGIGAPAIHLPWEMGK